jgi:threonine dehydrogenase-like Zn-dependent dehydrogenase
LEIREARLVAPRKIEICTRDLEPGPGQALLEIAACGYCMTDFHKYEGHDPDAVLPMVLGHEASGVVVKTNPERAEIRPGDRVTGAFEFAFATHAVAPLDRLIRIPEDVPLEHAIGEPLACVVNVARAANPELGDHVVLIGCGAMGLMLLTCLARSCAATVTAVDVLPERLELAAELGATHTVNSRDTDARATIMDITGGSGADVIVEFTGKPVGFQLAAGIVRYGRAKVLVPGSHIQPAEYNLWPLMLKGADMAFVHPAYSRDFDEDLRRGLTGLRSGLFALENILTHRFTLSNVIEGFEMARTGVDGYVKGLLLPNP